MEPWLEQQIEIALKSMRGRHPSRRGPYPLTDEQLDEKLKMRQQDGIEMANQS